MNAYEFFSKNILGLNILKRDIDTLNGSQWVNDVVINAYLTLLKIYSDKPIALTNTHFFKKN